MRDFRRHVRVPGGVDLFSREKQYRRVAFAACVFIAGVCTLSAAPAASARRAASSARIHLVPDFTPGQTFRYAVQMRTTTTSLANGPIVDAGGPKAFTQSIGVVIRLEVLSVSNTPGQPASARIRATYEDVAATSNSAASDPDAAAMEEQYRKLTGQSIEFTLLADGKITDVTGLNNLISQTDPSSAATLSQWLSQLTLGASLPKQGITIGDKWSSMQPVQNTPLAGLAWKTTASYLRNQPCSMTSQASPAAGVPTTPAAAAPDQCAVIMTHSEIVGGRGSKDRTPDVFRQNGLRTSGEWTGTTDSLSSISLRTGMVVSVTQTGSTHMDFTIMTTVTQRNRMRYAGDSHAESEISLLPQSAAP
jgi:hypothetical protein